MPQINVEQAMQIAIQHHQAGRLQQAEQIYRQILAQLPAHERAMHLLGLIAHQVGRSDDAVELIRRAIALKPDFSEAYNNLGHALRRKGKLDEAVAAFRQAVVLRPNYPKAYNNLGNALLDKEQVTEAIAAFRQAIVLSPGYAEAHNNLGLALRDTGQVDEAVAACAMAVALNPKLPEAHNNLGNALKKQGRLDEALASYGAAMALDPEAVEPHGNVVYTVCFHPGYGPQEILREARGWSRTHADPLAVQILPHENDRSPDRRLVIGYVSPHFCDHVLSRIMLPVIENHDRRHFHIHCFSGVKTRDGLTGRLRQSVDRWYDTAGLNDAKLADLVRCERIDILVDLNLHMGGSRLLTFARKPAPVQVTFAGYPGTTGLMTIDYRLTDPYLDPVGQDDEFYTEQSIRLPDSFWCYDPEAMMAGIEPAPQVGPPPAISKGYVTFGCLNNFCKVNDQVLSLWARVLKAVDGSRLMLMAPPGGARQRTLETLGRDGVDPARISYVAYCPRLEYFQFYHSIDIGLDTFPYNGHTTSLDSLWMGVPVVTLVGKTVVGRAGLSQLTNLKLTEVVATSEDQYVRIATDLAGDLPWLAELRAGLRQRMRESPLTDAPRFARNVESAYRDMWRRWCNKGK